MYHHKFSLLLFSSLVSLLSFASLVIFWFWINWTHMGKYTTFAVYSLRFLVILMTKRTDLEKFIVCDSNIWSLIIIRIYYEWFNMWHTFVFNYIYLSFGFAQKKNIFLKSYPYVEYMSSYFILINEISLRFCYIIIS